MKKLKLLGLLPALLSLSSCDANYEESVKTPLDWCVYYIEKEITSYDDYIAYTYTDLNYNFKEEREEIVKAYLITTYSYDQSYDYLIKTEWFCGIGFTTYYGFFVSKTNSVHKDNIEWIDCDVLNKTICNEGELELL